MPSDTPQEPSRGESRPGSEPGRSGRSARRGTGSGSDEESTRGSSDREKTGKLRSLLRRQFAVQVENVLPEDVQRVLDQLEERLESLRSGEEVELTDRVLRRVRLMGRMLRSWSEGSFSVPWRSIAAVSACLLYVTNPLDVLPGVLKGRDGDEDSLLDDALVIYLCYTLVEQDLRRFVEEHDLDPGEYGFEGSVSAL